MEYKEQLTQAAQAYIESMFAPEDINKPELKDAIDSVIADFKEGANWAANHKHASFEKADKAAHKYALNTLVGEKDADTVESIAGDFAEGAEWYYVDIAQTWAKKSVTVDGNEGYVIEEQPSLIRKVIDSLAWKIFIGVVLGLGAVWAFVSSIAGH